MQPASAEGSRGPGAEGTAGAAAPSGLDAGRAVVEIRDLPEVVRYLAVTGDMTDACLAAGALPLPVHFYSPVPDIPDLDRRGVWERRSRLEGIDFRPEPQLALLGELGRRFGAECDWPLADTGDPHRFFQNNGAFSFGCAAMLHGMLRLNRPRRVIEVGSGNSSRVISAALSRNGRDGHRAEYTIVDPYPAPATRTLPALTELVADRVELLPPGRFDRLQAGDLLFVDSSHTVKIGGDVNALILDVLPRLAPGVVVHFHDISLPFEYSRTYYTNPRFRVFWTESYLLQAFLSCNARYEVLASMALLMADHLDAFRRAFPMWDPVASPNTSGSLWIRSKPE